jgi:hypothetical protein
MLSVEDSRVTTDMRWAGRCGEERGEEHHRSFKHPKQTSLGCGPAIMTNNSFAKQRPKTSVVTY